MEFTYLTKENKMSKLIKNTIELDYESLSVHPMWINKEKRKDFDDKQTEIY